MNWPLIGHISWELFYWPGGIVLGNLLANIIWESPRTVILEWRLHKHHDRLMKKIGNSTALSGKTGGTRVKA